MPTIDMRELAPAGRRLREQRLRLLKKIIGNQEYLVNPKLVAAEILEEARLGGTLENA